MQRTSYLILRHLRHELGEQEREELQAWIHASDENRLFFERCTSEERLQEQLLAYGSFNTDAAWERFATSHQLTSAKVVKMRFRWWWAAAAAVVVLAAGIYLLQQKPSAEPIVVIQPPQREVLPGSSKAVLTLADGSAVQLDSTGNQQIRPGITQQGGQLEYDAANKTVGYNRLSTPKGGQFRLTLPDGTKVWLNAASSIRYPTAFAGEDRTVEVTGEAYFEVAQNATMPFRVSVDDRAAVEVLGTKFNVNAYTDESSIQATLLEGAVRVTAGQHSTILKPGQQAQIAPSGNIRVADNTNIDAVIAWKNEMFNFRDADIRTVMRQLTRWYDVDVEYAGAVPESRFQGEIQRNLPLSDVLEGLKTTGVRFTIEDRKIVVRP